MQHADGTARRTWGLVLGVGVLAGVLWWCRGGGEQAAVVVGAERGRGDGVVAGTGPRSRPGVVLEARLAERASIAGAVRDEQGRAIAGALVCAQGRSPRLASAETRGASCVKSEGDGSYRIDGLFGVRHSVVASAAGYVGGGYARGEGAARRDAVDLRAGQETRDVDIVLVGGGVELRGVVRDLSGGAVEGAQVSAEHSLGFSGEDGAFVLWVRPGDARVYADADGYTQGFEEGAAPGHLFELYLTPEAVLVGKVLRAGDGLPVEGARVVAEPGRSDWGQPSAYTDAGGNFRIVGLQPGPYKPEATADDAYGLAQEQVILGLGETSENVVISAHPAVFVEGVVVTPGGGGCDVGHVGLADEVNGRKHFGELEPDGVFRARGLLPGDFAVNVECAGFVPAPGYPRVVIAERSVEGLRWEVARGQSIRGVVVDGAGEGAARVTVGATPRPDVNAPRQQTTTHWGVATDAAGKFELAGLLPGVYTLELSSWEVARALPAKQPEVTLVAGKDLDGVRIELPATGEVRGRVEDERGVGVARAKISLRGDVDRQIVEAADDGSFWFAAVGVGDYRVTALRGEELLRAPGSGDDDVQGERVSVRGGATETVKLVVAGAAGTLSGVVRDAGGAPVADAFVEAARESESAAAAAGGALRDGRWSSFYDRPNLTDVDGRFTLTNLSPGKYTVRAHRRGGGEGVVEHAALGDSVALTIAEAGRMLGVVVLRGGGAPESFRVEVRDAASGFSRSDEFFRTDGAWVMGELPDGTYSVKVSSGAGTGEVRATMAGGDDTVGVRVELMPRVTVRGTIVDLSGQPVVGMRVSIGELSLDDGPDQANISDEAGRFTVTQAPTGAVQVSILPRNLGDPEWGWTVVPMRIEAREAGATVLLAPIRISKQRRVGEQAVGDLGLKTRDAEAGEDPLARRLIVAVVRPGGPAATAGLRVGDEIVSVDGQSVRGGDAYLFSGLIGVPAGTAVTLGLANGTSVQITAGKRT